MENGSFECKEHGEVKAEPAMVVSFIADDGTGVLRVVAFRDTAEKLTTTTASELSRLDAENILFPDLFYYRAGYFADIPGSEDKDQVVLPDYARHVFRNTVHFHKIQNLEPVFIDPFKNIAYICFLRLVFKRGINVGQY